jgi:crossover junction endodeoxyribonuclease RuvC
MKTLMLQNQITIGADPGVAGGIAIHRAGKVSTMPLARGKHDVRAFIANNCTREHTFAFMEQVGGYIGKEQPGAYMFTFGHSAGLLEGIFCGLDIPLTLVPPQKWQRAICPGVARLDYNVRKRAVKALAQSWYPDLDVTLALADALAILHYARQKPGEAAPVAITGRSRAAYAGDSKAFKRYCKAQGVTELPKGAEFMQGLNWWVENGRPAK